MNVLRPDDADAFRSVLRSAHRDSGAPVSFGGQLQGRTLVLEHFTGSRTTLMHGLQVQPGRGVGGRVVSTGAPVRVLDYGATDAITHDYDAEVLGEGIRMLVAAPVSVGGTVRGVLYAGSHCDAPLGDRVVDALVRASRRLAGELAVRDEVDRRLRLIRAAAPPAAPAPDLADLREELRAIAGQLQDPRIRARIEQVGARMDALTPARPSGSRVPVHLTARERDVLAQVSLGCSNAEAASRLGLLPETVKAYLRSASRKLDVGNRYQAVQAARALGLLT